MLVIRTHSLTYHHTLRYQEARFFNDRPPPAACRTTLSVKTARRPPPTCRFCCQAFGISRCRSLNCLLPLNSTQPRPSLSLPLRLSCWLIGSCCCCCCFSYFFYLGSPLPSHLLYGLWSPLFVGLVTFGVCRSLPSVYCLLLAACLLVLMMFSPLVRRTVVNVSAKRVNVIFFFAFCYCFRLLSQPSRTTFAIQLFCKLLAGSLHET